MIALITWRTAVQGPGPDLTRAEFLRRSSSMSPEHTKIGHDRPPAISDSVFFNIIALIASPADKLRSEAQYPSHFPFTFALCSSAERPNVENNPQSTHLLASIQLRYLHFSRAFPVFSRILSCIFNGRDVARV